MCDGALSVLLGSEAGRGYAGNAVNSCLSCTAHLYPFFLLSFLCLEVYEIMVEFFPLLVEPEEGGACQNDKNVVPKSCLNSKIPAVWLRNVCLEYPHRSAMKCVKIGKKHLKHRCLADVSHNTSSSSDMASCLSSIHMLMLNQAAQSGSISNHFFFFSSKQSIYLGER